MIKKISFLLITVALMTASACKKTPGEGGNARIRGKVWVKDYNSTFTTLQHEYYGQNIKVILTFGDNISPDLTVETNSNGEFEFQYLREGAYKITVYSQALKDATHPSGLIPVENYIDITKRKQIIDLGIITIQN
jgi:hypothetical protein